MDNLWTPGNKKPVHKTRSGGGLDDLLGDLLDDDNTKKKNASVFSSTTKKHTPVKKTNSRDEDFYSNLAATAEDGLSDVSEADVDQMAKNIADLEDMDADLFGGSLKKKGSVKGGSERSTPRRGGTPRSRSTTPRATSPQARVTSPTSKGPVRGTSPITRGSSPTRADTPTSPTGISPSRPGSGKRRTAAAAAASNAMSISPTPIPENKPGSAPGKMTDIGSASESLKPGSLNRERERPGRVPVTKPKFDFGEFNEDDPLAGLLSDEDDSSSAAKPVKSKASLKKQVYVEDSAQDLENETKRRNLFDRPPTRSGGNKTPEQDEAETQKPAVVTPAKKKEDPGIFSDDDDILGALDTEDKKTPTTPKKAGGGRLLPDDDDSDEDGSQPAKSIMDKLLSKDSVSKHLETNKERREFVLDKKYTKSANDDEDDFLFGSYQPSAASNTGSRPNSRRSVRFQDEDDIFGLNDRPTSRGRSPANKKTEDTDWLNDINSRANLSKQGIKTPASTNKVGQPQSSADRSNQSQPNKTAMSTDTPAKVSNNDKYDWLGLTNDDMSSQSQPNKTAMSTDTSAKVSNNDKYDWLGLTNDDMEDEEPSWLAKNKGQSTPLVDKHNKQSDSSQKSDNAKKHINWLEMTKDDDNDSNEDYLGLGKEIDPDTLLKGKTESPVFGGMNVKGATTVQQSAGVKDADIFSAGPTQQTNSFPPSMKPGKMAPLKDLKTEESSPSMGSPRALVISQISQLQDVNSINVAMETPIKQTAEAEQKTDFFNFSKEEKKTGQPVSTAQQQQQQLLTQQLQQQTGQQQILQQQTGQQQILQQQTGQQQILQQQTGQQQFLQQQTGQQQFLQQQTGQQQFLQQQAMLQQMMADLQKQYENNVRSQQIVPPPVTPMPMTFNLGSTPSSTLTNPPQSLLDAEARIRKLEIERDYSQSLLDSTKKRYEEEINAIENSYKSRLKLIEETQKSKEDRLREDNEQMLTHHLSRIRLLEEDKSNLMTQHYKKLEEYDREKRQDIEKIKKAHREVLDQLKRDHEDAMTRLQQAKDQQIEAAASSHDTTKSLVATVELIQNNARDLGELQKKVDNWHSMGLDEREISIRSKDEQLRILQERLTKQQEDNEAERQRMVDLTNRLETQLREQNRSLDEERWKLKQEHNRLQSHQASMEEERKLWTEQQTRERASIEKTRESLLEDEKSLLSQLHRERQSLAEERMQFNVNQKVQRDDMEHYTMKLAHAKAEYEALMKTISEEKSKAYDRRQELQRYEEQVREDKMKLQRDQEKQREKEDEVEEMATAIKMHSEEMMQSRMEAQKKYDEGEQALDEARAIEAEEKMRIDSIQEQQQILRIKEKEIAEERLRLSKDKKEVENLRFTLLCPNCRTPRNDPSAMKGITIPSMAVSGQSPITYGQSNGYSSPLISAHMQPTPNPAIQLSLNSVQTITESIKADRSIRMWKMEALKDQKYLEEQNMFLYTLRHMPYNNSTQNSG